MMGDHVVYIYVYIYYISIFIGSSTIYLHVIYNHILRNHVSLICGCRACDFDRFNVTYMLGQRGNSSTRIESDPEYSLE